MTETILGMMLMLMMMVLVVLVIIAPMLTVMVRRVLGVRVVLLGVEGDTGGERQRGHRFARRHGGRGGRGRGRTPRGGRVVRQASVEAQLHRL